MPLQERPLTVCHAHGHEVRLRAHLSDDPGNERAVAGGRIQLPVELAGDVADHLGIRFRVVDSEPHAVHNR